MFTSSEYIIQVYFSIASTSHIYIKGRILKDKAPISYKRQGLFSSLFNTFLRANSRELPFVPITLVLGENQYKEVTDSEGYFEFYQLTNSNLNANTPFRLNATIKEGSLSTDGTIRMYEKSKNGIISDIDDTIMVSRVKSFFKLKLLFNTLFLNPFRRRPIQNAAQSFDKLLDSENSPMIYLSNSPWNIYDYLKTFLAHNNFPEGVLVLRDMGVQQLKSRAIEEYNKYIEIEKMLTLFDETEFVLVGDTGEKDFDIYKSIIEKHTDRISKIILKKAGNKKKEEEIKAFEKRNHKVKMVDEFL